MRHQREGGGGAGTGLQGLTARQHALERSAGRHDAEGGNAEDRLHFFRVLDVRVEVLEQEGETDAAGEPGDAGDQEVEPLARP